LIKDLKGRGLLESTIVMWAGEFGRLPTTENSDGRDHNRNAFTLLFAGGGCKPGLTYGKIDEFGYKAEIDGPQKELQEKLSALVAPIKSAFSMRSFSRSLPRYAPM